MAATRILIVDKRALLRELLTSFLASVSPTSTVDTASGAVEGLRRLEVNDYDLIIARCEPSGLDGLSLATEVRRRRLGGRVILIGYDETTSIELYRALKAGAVGYLAPGDGLLQLQTAIEVALRNNIFVSESALGDNQLSEVVYQAHEFPPSPFDRLTSREREILQLISEGFSTAQIASALAISTHTVDGHRASLMTKAGAHSTAEVLRWLRTAEELDACQAASWIARRDERETVGLGA